MVEKNTKIKVADKFHKVVINKMKDKHLIMNQLNMDQIAFSDRQNYRSKMIDGVVDPNFAIIRISEEWELVYYLNETKNVISICLKTKTLKYGWNYDSSSRSWKPCFYMNETAFKDVELSEETNKILTDILLDFYNSGNLKQKEVLTLNGLLK